MLSVQKLLSPVSVPLTRIKYNLQFLVQQHEPSKMVDLCDNYCKYHLSIIEVSDFCHEIN